MMHRPGPLAKAAVAKAPPFWSWRNIPRRLGGEANATVQTKTDDVTSVRLSALPYGPLVTWSNVTSGLLNV